RGRRHERGDALESSAIDRLRWRQPLQGRPGYLRLGGFRLSRYSRLSILGRGWHGRVGAVARALSFAPGLWAALAARHQRLSILEGVGIGLVGAARQIDHGVDVSAWVWMVEQPRIGPAGGGACFCIVHKAVAAGCVADRKIEPVAHAHAKGAIA